MFVGTSGTLALATAMIANARTSGEKSAFYTMLDALIAKKKLKDNLTNVLQSI